MQEGSFISDSDEQSGKNVAVVGQSVVDNLFPSGIDPLGQQVRASAKLIEIDGRRLVFQVEAYDEQRQIGEGRHERFIVNLERFLKQ